MSGKKDRPPKDKLPKDRFLSEDEKSLWQMVTATIKRNLPRAEEKAASAPLPSSKSSSGAVKKTATPGYAPEPARPAPAAKGKTLDARTEQRLRQGKIPIDDVLDLHGLNQAAAQALLVRRVTAAHRAGRRLVLVITGKGTRSGEAGGVLKNALPRWCALPPLDDMILKRVAARPQHGGGGAVYLYLRRPRA